MGLFGHMRIHESGIDRSPDTPTTSNTSTAPSPILAPPPCAPITTSTITASSLDDTDTTNFSCPHCPRRFTSRIGLIGHLRIHRTETVTVPAPTAAAVGHTVDIIEIDGRSIVLYADNLGTADEEILDPFKKFATDAHDSQLVLVVHSALKALDKGCREYACAFLDYSSAFNTVPRPLLLTKTSACGSPGWVVSWLSDYFTSRTQFVQSGKRKSSTLPNDCGVLQGSILSPHLFALHTDDLRSPNDCLLVKYADDVVVGNPPKSQTHLRSLKDDLNHVLAWSEENGLLINNQKSVLCIFRLRPSPNPDSSDILPKVVSSFRFFFVSDVTHSGRDVRVFLFSGQQLSTKCCIMFLKKSQSLSGSGPCAASQFTSCSRLPAPEAPYSALKEALISRISLSTQKRLQRLISEEDLGDRKPTQLLRRLEQLADGQKLDATMFKQLFLQRLPPSVQAILAPNIPYSTVQTLAETADRILEYYQPPVTVNVASQSTIVPTIEDVVKRLDALTLEVSQLRATRGYNPRSPAITRRPRSPTPNQPTVDGFCWYHHNYGSNAHRCHSPCKYKPPASENPHADQ
ncbi:hypothetical protein SprV_0602244000 [Sparganum proliferum]